MIQDLLDLKKEDKKDIIPLGEAYSILQSTVKYVRLVRRIKPLF